MCVGLLSSIDDSVLALSICTGANVNHQDHDDDTALIYASWNGHLEVVIALIEAGRRKYEALYHILRLIPSLN